MRQKLFKILKKSFIAIVVILVIVLWSALSYFTIGYVTELLSDPSSEVAPASDQSKTEDCNVYGINLHGEIVVSHENDAYNDQGKLALNQTSADEVWWAVKKAMDNDKIKAIVVEVESGGGIPEAGEEMMTALKQSNKPVVAYIRSGGMSSAYLAATGAQTIFASKFSDVGSIGVTMSYFQETDKNKKDGLTYIDLSSGKYKDTGNAGRPLSEDEKQLYMRDVKIAYEYFVDIVAKNRNLDVEKVRKLADGSSLMGEAALKAGLIDKIGLWPDVEKFLAEKVGEKVSVCWQN